MMTLCYGDSDFVLVVSLFSLSLHFLPWHFSLCYSLLVWPAIWIEWLMASAFADVTFLWSRLARFLYFCGTTKLLLFTAFTITSATNSSSTKCSATSSRIGVHLNEGILAYFCQCSFTLLFLIWRNDVKKQKKSYATDREQEQQSSLRQK